jgi:hypothetical protein
VLLIMKSSVVALTGLAHSGKDTSADYLVKMFSDQGLSVIKVGLADRLKYICKHLIKLFYNIDVPIEDFYDLDKKEMIREDYPAFSGKPFKLRTILQLVGSEIFREMLWSSVWCDYVSKNLLSNGKYDVVIISDCRFQDELDYFSNLHKQGQISNMFSCRILRPSRDALSIENQNHQSERYILTLDVQNEIHNVGTKEALYLKLNKLFV